MRGTQPPQQGAEDDAARDARLLAWDLACVAGASSEIAATWRRSGQEDPELPLGLPEHLHDTARELEAAARSLAAAGPGPASEQAARLARRIAELTEEAATVRTAGGDAAADVGDALLWESLAAALHDAAAHARHLATR